MAAGGKNVVEARERLGLTVVHNTKLPIVRPQGRYSP